MKKMMVLAACLWSVFTVQAQYFPTDEGTELEYVYYDEAGQSTQTETMTVKEVKQNGDAVEAKAYSKIVKNKAKYNTSYSLYNFSYKDGVTSYCEDLIYREYIDADADPAQYTEAKRMEWADKLKFEGNNAVLLKDDAKAGETMPDWNYSILLNMLKNNVTISGASYMGTEKVSTTAGKFDCIKISYLKRTKIVLKTETLRVTEWYAEEVGLVKSEAYDTKGKLHDKVILVKKK